jgi:predicted phosphodiesterase
VLADIKTKSVDKLVCLGDAIQGGPQPAELVQRLRENKIPTVMGNSDAWLLSGIETDNLPEERRKKLNTVREWSLAQLSEEDKTFISEFQPTITIPLESGRNLFCFHGSPKSFDEVIFPETPNEEFENILGAYNQNILCGGHTHMQFMRRLRDTQNSFFNPGSVGLAYNHEQSTDALVDPWAEYGILTVNGLDVSLEFRRVPLEMKTIKEIYLKSGRPFAEVDVEKYKAY